MEIEFGKQRRLAEAVGVSPQRINDYLSGRRNASPKIAQRLGDKTGSDPFIWVLPGSAPARQAAVAGWSPPAAEAGEGAAWPYPQVEHTNFF